MLKRTNAWIKYLDAIERCPDCGRASGLRIDASIGEPGLRLHCDHCRKLILEVRRQLPT